MDLLPIVAATIEAAGAPAPGETILVAVSGGADSLALVHLLHRLAPERGWRLVGVHCNHGWHPDADAWQARVLAYLAELGLPACAYRADPPERSEAAARAWRWARLRESAAQAGADRIAVGHTADDRAETLLLNLLRGTGTQGLGTLPAADGSIVRPLIDCRRDDVRTYAVEQGLPVIDDPANEDEAYLRVRLRRSVLPVLDAASPGAVTALTASARLCEHERAVLGEVGGAELAARRVVPEAGAFLEGAPALAFGLGGWAGLLPARRWLALRAAVRELRGDLTDVDQQAIGELDRLALGPPTAGTLRAAGLHAGRWSDRLLLLCGAPPSPWGPLPLAVPGCTELPHGVTLLAGAEAEGGGLAASLRPVPGLAARSRRDGDRLRPAGRGGSRKLSDLFAERGVPALLRDRVPVVIDGDRVVWVPGGPPDEAYLGELPVAVALHGYGEG